MRASARVARSSSKAMLHRERTEAAQFNAVAARKRCGDLAEHRIHDVLDVALIEMRILPSDALNQFGFDHRRRRPLLIRVRVRLRDGHGAFLNLARWRVPAHLVSGWC